MVGIHRLLQLMGGRHYMKINTRSSSQLCWQEQQEPDAKRTGRWFDPSVLPSWMPGEDLREGGKCMWPAPEQRGWQVVSGAHAIITSSQPYQSTCISGQMHPFHKDVIWSSILPIIKHRHNSATWQRSFFFIREEEPYIVVTNTLATHGSINNL